MPKHLDIFSVSSHFDPKEKGNNCESSSGLEYLVGRQDMDHKKEEEA